MILIDLNILLDVIQARQPHYNASASILEFALSQKPKALIPAHAVTTIHYLVNRYNNLEKADDSVQWLLKHFKVAELGVKQLKHAQSLGWTDFEDAVVAATAEISGCEFIITRNIKDFSQSKVPALTPDEYLVNIVFQNI